MERAGSGAVWRRVGSGVPVAVGNGDSTGPKDEVAAYASGGKETDMTARKAEADDACQPVMAQRREDGFEGK